MLLVKRKYPLMSLFEDLAGRATKDVKYTLKHEDHKGYPSLYKLYIQEDDITEYEFATKYLEGWGHWEALLEQEWFIPIVQEWRNELEVKARSKALREIVREAADGSKHKYEANKFLVTAGWTSNNKEDKKNKGRPSKEEIRQRLYDQALKDEELDNDLKRITN